MIVQIVLTLGLLGLFTWALVRRFEVAMLRIVFALTAVAGIFFVWYPERLTDIAHTAGVGRGADLMIYLMALVLLFVVVGLVNQNRITNSRITALVRALALEKASAPAGPERAGAKSPGEDRR